MPDWPAPVGFWPTPTILTNVGGNAAGGLSDRLYWGNAVMNTSTAWLLANLGLFYPVVLARPFFVNQMAWHNGAIITSNVDVGIYDLSGNRIVSHGGGAQTGASTIEIRNVTDTWLEPGTYFLALSCSTNTGTFLANVAANYNWRTHGVCEATAVYPLPSTVTLAGTTRAYANMVMASSLVTF